KQVRRIADVTDRERLVERRRLGIPLRLDVLQGVKVIGAAGNRPLEYRGIRCCTAEPVFNDQAAELAAGEQAAPKVVQPDRLSESLQCSDRVLRLKARLVSRLRHDRIGGRMGHM